jgi:branched-subunit amino acid transport protein AzlD
MQQIINFLDNWLPAIIITLLVIQVFNLEKRVKRLEDDLQRDKSTTPA